MSDKSGRVKENLVSGDVLGTSIMASAAEDQSDVYSLELLKDFPPGPLDEYRKKATFDWKKMRLFLDGEDILRFKVRSFVTVLDSVTSDDSYHLLMYCFQVEESQK